MRRFWIGLAAAVLAAGGVKAEPVRIGFAAESVDYAPAWAWLAATYIVIPGYDPAGRVGAEGRRRLVDLYRPKAEAAAQRS